MGASTRSGRGAYAVEQSKLTPRRPASRETGCPRAGSRPRTPTPHAMTTTGPPAPGTTPTKVLYVLGSQRGGTTILGRLLGTIDGVEFGGEMRNLWGRGLRGPRSCGCGKGQWDCEVWSRVLAELGDVDPD